MKQLESGFERTINWNEYQSKITEQERNRYLAFLIDSSFQGKIELFILSFENRNVQENHRQHSLPVVEIKDHNVMNDGRNFFYGPVKK